MQESVSSKKYEELKAWKKRSEVMKKTITMMESKVEDLTNKSSEFAKFKGQQGDLEKDELEMLRRESKKANSVWSTKKDVD